MSVRARARPSRIVARASRRNLCDFNSDSQSHTLVVRWLLLVAVMAMRAPPTTVCACVCLNWRCHFPNLMPRDVLPSCREILYGTSHIPKSQTVEGFRDVCLDSTLVAHTHTHATSPTHSLTRSLAHTRERLHTHICS